MELPHGEVVEAETELGRDIGIWVLFLWQRDVETDRLGSDIARAPVGGLHDSRTATRHNHDPASDSPFARSPDNLAELAGHFVVSALLCDPPRNLETTPQGLIIRIRGERPGACLHRAPGGLRFAYARAAENNDRVGDTLLLKQAFRFEEIELQADAARGLAALQKVYILIGLAVGRRLQNSAQSLRRTQIVLGRLRVLARQCLSPVDTMGGPRY